MKKHVLLAAVAIVLAAWLWMLENRSDGVVPDDMGEAAAQYIRLGFETLSVARPESMPDLEFRHDINATGLVGVAWSEITTSGGNLEAKRTATDPQWGNALIQLLENAGVERGDNVAAAFSGSFPGMNLAVIAAARAMDLNLYVTASVGASNYGANHPDFTWLDMEDALMEAGWPQSYFSQTVTMGGGRDMASNLDPQGRDQISAAIQRRGAEQLRAGTLEEMVELRLQAIDAAFDQKPRLYINVGGASASVGFCPDWQDWNYGVIDHAPDCPAGTPGVMHAMLDEDVPVLHLLNIRGLAAEMGIPLDRRFN